MAFNNEIERVKAQIFVLEKKLALLEEMENHKTPCEIAYKDWWGEYPGDENWTSDATRWQGFQAGYNAAYEEKVPQELEVREWDVIRESVKWCEEHPGQNPLDWVKPQTPEQVNTFAPKELEELVEEGMKHQDDYPYKKYTPEETEQSLKEAFVKAQQTERWKEIQKLIDEEDNDKNFKNSFDLIKEWGEKNKPKTLYQICMEWWNEVFVNQMDDDICVDVLVSKIDKEFIPPSSKRNTYEWEKCLKIMRDKLR